MFQNRRKSAILEDLREELKVNKMLLERLNKLEKRLAEAENIISKLLSAKYDEESGIYKQEYTLADNVILFKRSK